MKIEYNQNPLKSRVILDEQDLYLLRTAILVDALDSELYDAYSTDRATSYDKATDAAYEEVERVLPYYLSALDGETHWGDCTNACCSCTKCHAEDYLSISTLIGIREPYYVDRAFDEGRQTLDEAIKYLRNNPAKATWEGSEPYVEGWQRRQDITIEDLMRYKELHFSA